MRTSLILSPDFFLVNIIIFLATSLSALAVFLVILGQVGMTGRIILNGHTNLRDWSASIRNHFRVVLGLGLILYPVFVLSLGAANLLTFNLMSLLRLSPGNLFIRWIINTPVESLVLSLFYIILAPAILDRRGIWESIRYGLRAVQSGPGIYLAYLGILILISTVTTIIQIPLEGSLDTIASEGGRAVSSPFLFILAFLIYSKNREVQ